MVMRWGACAAEVAQKAPCPPVFNKSVFRYQSLNWVWGLLWLHWRCGEDEEEYYTLGIRDDDDSNYYYYTASVSLEQAYQGWTWWMVLMSHLRLCVCPCTAPSDEVQSITEKCIPWSGFDKLWGGWGAFNEIERHFYWIQFVWHTLMGSSMDIYRVSPIDWGCTERERDTPLMMVHLLTMTLRWRWRRRWRWDWVIRRKVPWKWRRRGYL